MKLRIRFVALLFVLLAPRVEGQDAPETTPTITSADQHGKMLREDLRGLSLLDTFTCGACHGSVAAALAFPAKEAPNLAWAAGRIDPRYIEEFIADPLKVKPGTTMPSVMGELRSKKRSKAAKAITHYLMSLGATTFERQPIDAAAGVRGRELFHSVGCVACHSPRDEDGRELLATSSEPLPNLAFKYNLEGLTALLEDPHAVRPSERMPNLQLTHWEALDIAHYLLEDAESAADSSQPFRIDPKLVKLGRKRFKQLNCVQCHAIEGMKGRQGFPSLAETDTEHGCLSGNAGAWPNFDLDDSERSAMRAAINRGPQELTGAQQIDLTLTAFNCVACHERAGLGDIEVARDDYFQTADVNLGPRGRIPPPLTGVGAKLNPEWMRRVLVSGHMTRPYMKTRMPRFGAENVAHLIDLFQRVDQVEDVAFAHFEDENVIRKAAVEMVGIRGLSCISCHTFQQKPAQTMQGLDLTEMAERLQQGWFYRYMKDPQQFSPGAVMPTFFQTGQAPEPLIDLDTNDQQIEALWQYLLDGRQARTPRGLVAEPMELIVGDEAVMLRRQYAGIGKRGIGVGYPGHVSLAFDAEQMRFDMIWKGKFADPAPVWRGQGSGRVRVLGTDRFGFAPGPELDDTENPWVVDEGRPPNHQFQGYYLDTKRRPTFMYRFGEIAVEDYPVDVVDAATGVTRLRRTLTFTSEQAQRNIAFRAATGETITHDGDNIYLIDGTLRIHVDSDIKAEIIAVAAGKQLRIPLDIGAGTSTLVLEYDW